MNANCFYCGEPLNPASPRVGEQVWGWQFKGGTRPGGAHGGSDIRYRQSFEPKAFAHEHCVDKERKGINARQDSLV